MRFHISFFLAAAVAVAPVAAVAAEHDVSMRENTFSPSALHIKAGDTIKFVNYDTVSHVVYSLTPGHYFASGRQAPGTRTTFSFNRPGAFDVVASGEYGSAMKLHVVVVKR